MTEQHAARATGNHPDSDPRIARPMPADAPADAPPGRPGDVDVICIALDDCRLARPRRPLPDDLERWVETLPLLPPFGRFGMAATLRSTLLKLWRGFEASLARGIEVRVDATGREVVFCGALVYRIDGAGHPIRTHRIDVQGHTYSCDLDLLRPLPDWAWVGTVLGAHAGLMWDLRCDLEARNLARVISPFQAIVLMQHAWRWLVATITRMARRTLDRRALRARLREALALDVGFIAPALRMRPPGAAGAWLVRVAAWHDVAREMERVAPGLLPLFGARLAEPDDGGLMPSAQPLAAIRRQLRAARAARVDWRFLLTDPARPVWRMVRAGRIRGLDDIAGFLVDWARLHRGLPGDLRLPSALWEPLCATWTEPADDRVRPPVRWPFGPDVTVEAIRRWRDAAQSGRGEAYVVGEFGLLVRWAADYAEEGRPRLCSYRNAVAAARRHDRRLRAAVAAASSRPWDFPRPPEVFGRWTFVPLATPLDLVEEAIALHHCADQRASGCEAGHTRLYGIRRREDGKRHATLEVRCLPNRGGPQLVELRGPLNRPVPEPLRSLARRFVQLLGPWPWPASSSPDAC